MRWFRRDEGGDSRPPPPAGAVGRSGDIGGLQQEVRGLVRKINASSGHLPTGAVVEARDICDRLRELLDHEARIGAGAAGEAAGAGTYEMVTLTSIIRDYLPTSLDTYLALPASFHASHRNAAGETPAEELATQLVLMRTGVDELAAAVYAGDAQRLSIQSRFLDAKFASSDLDLGRERPDGTGAAQSGRG